MRYKYLIFGVTLALCGCTKRITIPVEQVRIERDTIIEREAKSDTVIWRDSVVIIDRGDTVRQEFWHTREKVKWRDAGKTHISHDTVVREVPVVVAEERMATAGPKSIITRLKYTAETLIGVLGLALIVGLIITYKFIKQTRR